MKYSLKNEYEELLKEEKVSIIRDDNYSEEIFDVSFDDEGNIISGIKFKPLENKREDRTYRRIFDQSLVAQDFTNESRLKIVNFLEKLMRPDPEGSYKGYGILQPCPSDPIKIVERLNRHFKETINWEPSSKIGRGEVSIRLAYKSKINHLLPGEDASKYKEPDFIGWNEKEEKTIRLSVKSFLSIAKTKNSTRDDSGKVRTGTNLDDKIKEILDKFNTSIFNGSKWELVLSPRNTAINKKIKNVSPDGFKDIISAQIKKYDDNTVKIEKLRKVLTLIDEVKQQVIQEHGAAGIVAITKSREFIFISPDMYQDLFIFSFDGKRILFGLTNQIGSGGSWEKAIEELISEFSKIDNTEIDDQQQDEEARETEDLTDNVKAEIYKNRKNMINEGGKAGHMMHPYENLHLKISDMKEMIRDFQNDFEISEKVDGANLFFTINPDSGELLFSRNKSDMTREETLEKFGPAHPAHILFTEGANSIYNAAKSALSRKDTREIFGKGPEGGKTYINFEIMHPKKPNQIKYDMKYIVFHSIVDFDINGSKVSSSADDPRLLALISKLNPYFATQDNDFNLGSNFKVKLNALSDSDIEELMSELNNITSRLNLSDDMTIADAVKSEIVSLLDQNNLTEMLSEEKIEMIYDFITNESSTVTGNIIKKDLDKEIKKSLVGLGLTSKTKAYKIIKNITKEFRPLFILLGIKLLHNIPSRYMSSEASSKNVNELRRLLNAALEDYDNLVNLENPSDIESRLINTLSLHVANIRSHGIERSVSSPIEGGVFIGKDGNTYKVTGGFAPLNQILGTAMRNLDNMPIFEREFDLQERRS